MRTYSILAETEASSAGTQLAKGYASRSVEVTWGLVREGGTNPLPRHPDFLEALSNGFASRSGNNSSWDRIFAGQ